MDTIKEQQELLNRYLEGKATPEERQRVENWYHSFEHTPDNHSVAGINHIKAELQDRVYKQVKFPRAGHPRILHIRAILKVAGAILLPVVTGLLAWQFLYIRKTSAPPIKWIAITTKAGERKKVVLADSSEVWLNAASRVLYPEKFNSGERVVKLVAGEAFFRVHHDKSHPFRVIAPGGVYTRVLGTEFNIAAYPQTGEINVGVISGKVAVGRGKTEWTQLTRGHGWHVNIATWAGNSMYSLYYAAWTENKLMIDDMPLSEVAAVISRSYGITVRVDSQVNSKLRCRGRFNLRQRPEEIVSILCTLHKLDFEKTNNTIIIKRRL